eukprot:jgi/Bigna1/130251/aug1.10_g4959
MGRKPSDPNRLYCSDEDARDIRSSSTSGKSVKIPCVDGKSDIVINNTMMKQKVHGLFKKCLEVQSDSGVKIPLVVANPLDGRVIYSSNLNSKESVNQNHDDHPAANKASSKLTRHRNASHSLKKWDNLNRSLCSIEKRIHDFDESRRVSKADLKKRPNCQMRSTVPPQQRPLSEEGDCDDEKVEKSRKKERHKRSKKKKKFCTNKKTRNKKWEEGDNEKVTRTTKASEKRKRQSMEPSERKRKSLAEKNPDGFCDSNEKSHKGKHHKRSKKEKKFRKEVKPMDA